MHYSDRSRYELDKYCQRARFWQYHFEGPAGEHGVEPVGDGLDLLFGSAIHSFLEGQPQQNEDSLKIRDLTEDLVTPDGHSQWSEWEALYLGLCGTYDRWLRPQIAAEYEVVGSEVEITIDLTPEIKWMSRLDKVLRRKADGLWFVLEAKTSSWIEKLMATSRTNFQLLMELEAMRRHYSLGPEQVGGALLLVFDKGQKRKTSAAEQARGIEGYRRISPFTYCYKKDYVNGTTSYGLDYRAGWDRTPTWTIPGWTETLFSAFEEQARAMVQLLPSISFDQTMLESILSQVLVREGQLVDYKTGNQNHPGISRIDEFFGQNFLNCSNHMGFGRDCPYKATCFSPAIGRDPVGSGEYEWRSANHPQEKTV